MDNIINSLFKPESKFIICGDFNMDYATDNEKKRKLEAMLQTYNLSSIVHFPTRIQNQSKTLIDNIFIDTHKITNYTVGPLYNGLSDHDAQLLKVMNVNPQVLNYYTHYKHKHKQIYYTRFCN
jgi:endonuclease/exonuclease/phosphatase family metal-dependent hydrolase